MSKYYEVVDISQKPDKDDWYYVMNPNKEILPQMIEYKMGIFHNYNNASASYYLKPIDHLPLSTLQADPSALVEALEKLRKEYKETIDKYKEFSNNAYAAMNPKAADMWRHKSDGLVQAERDIRKLISTYKESKPSPSITREQAEKIWDAAWKRKHQEEQWKQFDDMPEATAPDKETYLKQFDKQ